MLRWLFVLLLIPFFDAVVLAIVVSQTDVIGWAGMVLLVVLTGLVGLVFVRAEGRRTLRKIQVKLANGEAPTDQLLDGAFLIAAGAFLLTPGLVTDLLGFLLVVPITRIPIRAACKRFVVVPYVDSKTGGFASGGVWTVGFPEQGPTAESTDDRPYDLDEDAYRVDESSYTVEFGDDADDGRDDPSAR